MTDYEVAEYPNSRVATFDVGKIGRKKHHITGLIEADKLQQNKKSSRIYSQATISAYFHG